MVSNIIAEKYDLRKSAKKEWLWVFLIFTLFLFLRIFCWLHVYKVEDIDSIWYLNIARNIKRHHWSSIGPSDTLFYPALIVLFAFLGLKLQSAARVVSLLSSIILFFSIYFLGKKIAGLKSTLTGLIIFSLSPFLINFSVSILSEPSYVALVFIGFFLFRYFIEKPKLSIALLIGLVYGLSFVDRTEGIIFLVFIPLLQLAHFIFWKQRSYSFSKLALWMAFFVIGFSIFAVPTIVRVSNEMGEFTINARTAWEDLLKNSAGGAFSKSYYKNLYGLTYSPSEVNLDYIIQHPKQLKDTGYSENIFHAIRLYYDNISDLYRAQMGSLLGTFVIVFFAFGLYYLFKERKYLDLFLILSFFCAVLIPPLWQKFFLTRHIVLIAPIMILVAGIGVYKFSLDIENSMGSIKLLHLFENEIAFLIICLMIFLSLDWLNDSLRHPSQNNQYDYSEFVKPISILKNDIKERKIEDPKLLSRHPYFPYFADVEALAIPYTDYNGLVKYCTLNKANYLLLNFTNSDGVLESDPFVKNFIDNNAPDFVMMYSGKKENGKNIADFDLYRFNPPLRSLGKTILYKVNTSVLHKHQEKTV
jgi:hypothetical protein